jgi:hypothetical protein
MIINRVLFNLFICKDQYTLWMNNTLIQDREFTALCITSLPRLKHLTFISFFRNVFVYPSFLKTCLNHGLLFLLFFLFFFTKVTSFILLNNLMSFSLVLLSYLFQLSFSRILFCKFPNYIFLFFIFFLICC